VLAGVWVWVELSVAVSLKLSWPEAVKVVLPPLASWLEVPRLPNLPLWLKESWPEPVMVSLAVCTTVALLLPDAW
jgi:hypothetical protein